MTLKRGYHCVYNTHYHLVLPIKYRRILLSEPIVQKIKEIVIEIEERFEVMFEKIGTDHDHIHLLLSFHPKYSGGEVVRIFKSITAREIFKIFYKSGFGRKIRNLIIKSVSAKGGPASGGGQSATFGT